MIMYWTTTHFSNIGKTRINGEIKKQFKSEWVHFLGKKGELVSTHCAHLMLVVEYSLGALNIPPSFCWDLAWKVLLLRCNNPTSHDHINYLARVDQIKPFCGYLKRRIPIPTQTIGIHEEPPIIERHLTQKTNKLEKHFCLYKSIYRM